MLHSIVTWGRPAIDEEAVTAGATNRGLCLSHAAHESRLRVLRSLLLSALGACRRSSSRIAQTDSCIGLVHGFSVAAIAFCSLCIWRDAMLKT